MDKKRNNACGSSKWQMEAKRRLANRRQQLSMARVLARGDIVVEVAATKGVRVGVDGSGLCEFIESSSFNEIQMEAHRRLSKWDQNMTIAEEAVYGSFLVDAAREAGVDVDGLVKLPMLNEGIKSDQSIQVNIPSPE